MNCSSGVRCLSSLNQVNLSFAGFATLMLLLVSLGMGTQSLRAQSTTTLSVSSASVSVGTAVILTATVKNGTTAISPGLVLFCDASASECQDMAVLGSAQLTTAGTASTGVRLGVGTHIIYASFVGTTAHSASMSSAQTVVVNSSATYPSFTTIAASGSASNYTLSGTVAGYGPTAPSGTVTFLDMSNGNASLGSTSLGMPGYALQAPALYGDSNSSCYNDNCIAVASDIDGDGISDVVYTDYSRNTVSISIGNGDGSLQAPVSYATGTSPGYLAVGDFDGDGVPDLAVSNHGSNTVGVFIGNGDGTFQSQVTYGTGTFPAGVTVGDFNGDGIEDILVGNSSNSISVLLGNGDGTFQPRVSTSTVGPVTAVAVADFDDDGILDVAAFVNGTSAGIAVFLGNGNGTFHLSATYPSVLSNSIAVADFDQDGFPDIVYANRDSAISIMLGYGDGRFQTAIPYSVGSSVSTVAIGDFNLDGAPDVVALGTETSILYGNGDGTFQLPISYTGTGSGVAVADMNGDGLPDVVANAGGSKLSVSLDAQVAKFSTSGISFTGVVGLHNVVASYSGSSPYTSSTSSAVGLTSSNSTPTLTVVSSSSSSVYGGSVMFTATISSGPTGTMKFYDGSTLIGSGTISGTTATFSTSSLSGGSHSITAGWAGNTIYSPVNSGPIVQLVNTVTPTLSVGTSGTPSAFAGPVTFTATVSSGPTGTVNFYDRSTLIGSGTITGATATFTTSVLAVGSHVITASWAGNTNYSPVTSTLIMQMVNPATPSLTVSTSSTPSTYGGSVTFTASVSSGPTGTVTFYSGGISIGIATISGTTATFSTSALTVGLHSITAGWPGNTNYNAVTSRAITQAVNNSTENTTLSVSSSSVSVGTAVTLTATVKNGTTAISPGLVLFCDASAAECEDMAVLGSAQLTSAGTAATGVRLGVGTHHIYAVFVGTTTYPPSTSSAQTVAVTSGTSYASTTTLEASGSATNFTLSGSIAGFGSAAPTGAVTFLDTSNSNAQLGSATLTSPGYALQGPVLYGDDNSICYNTNCIAVASDVDGDGIPDVVYTNYSANVVSVSIGNGDGTFQTAVSYATGTSPGFIAVGDFNADGIPDLVVSNNGSNTVGVFIGNGNGTFQTQVAYGTSTSPAGVTVADFNGDGIEDLLVLNSTSNNMSVMLGNGDGTFQSRITGAIISHADAVAVADFNGDGILDVAATIDTGSASTSQIGVLLGNGNGTFQTSITYPQSSSYSIAVADFNLDGIPDLVYSNAGAGTVSVMLGHGDGTFQAAVPYMSNSGSVAVGDFNQDGIPDIVVPGTAATSVLLGNGDGTFQPQISYAATGGGVAVADLNGDGLPDVVSVNHNLSVLLNSRISNFSASGISFTGVVGLHNVVASYPGSSPYAASTSNTVGLTSSNTTPALTLVSSSPSSVYGGSVTFTATISSGPTGTITFYDNGTSIGSGMIGGSAATLTKSTLAGGIHLITAGWGGNTTYSPVTSSPITQTVNAATPTLTFTSVATQTYGVAPLSVSASSASTGTITYSVTSGPATISGSTLTLAGAGTVVLIASQAATTNYNASTASISFTVNKASPTLTFTSIAAQSYGVAPLSVIASSASTGAVTYTVTSGPATISGSTLTITGVGTVVLGASQASTTNYNTATASTSFTVNKGTPMLNFASIATQAFGVVPFKVSATSASTGAVTYSVTSGPATISGSTLTITGAGTVFLAATQVATTNYNTASASASFTVTNATATLLFTPIGTQIYGVAPFTVSASSASTGAITYSVTSGPATISGSTLTITGVGTVVLGASQTATSSYSATTASTSFAVNSAIPTLTVASSASTSALGASVTFTATISSGPTGTVTFYDGNTSIGTATISGTTATYSTSSLTSGVHSITAAWAGNSDYNSVASSAVVQTVGTWDTGTITLTVNSTPAATAAYGSGATPSTIAAALVTSAASNPGSPVTLSASGGTLTITAKTTGLGSDYTYSLNTTYDSHDFSQPSFTMWPAAGYLDGGDSSDPSGIIYQFKTPSTGYDGVGNLLSYTDTVMGSWTFKYDTLNRLAGATANQPNNPNTNYCWSYDEYGNRTMQAASNAAFETGSPTCAPQSGASYYPSWVHVDTNNRVIGTPQSPDNGPAHPGLLYDTSGDLTNDGVSNQYRYDAEGRICAMSSTPIPGNTIYTGYLYDAAGQRVGKGSLTSLSCDLTSNGFTPTNDYVLGPGGEQLTELNTGNGSMAWAHTNVYAGGSLIATYDTNGMHFYSDDPLGTRRAQTDYAGVLEQTCSSLPFGDNLQCNGAIPDPTENHFTGKERDSESGNDYFDARYYSSSMGRFMSPDWSAKEEPVPYAKLDNPQSLNLYSYVLNNPVTAFDNDGHEIIFAANATQVMRDSVQAILANPNTSSNLSGYVGPNNPNLTIQSGDLSSMDSHTLTPDGAPGGSITQGVTAPDIQTSTSSSTDSNGVTTTGPPETTLIGATITIDNRTSAGDTPGVMVHETVHAGEARANPAQYNKDAKAEHANPCHNCRPQEQRANAAQKKYGSEIKKAVKQIEKDRKKEKQ